MEVRLIFGDRKSGYGQYKSVESVGKDECPNTESRCSKRNLHDGTTKRTYRLDEADCFEGEISVDQGSWDGCDA